MSAETAAALLAAIEAIFTDECWEKYDFAKLKDDLTMEVKLTKTELLALRDAIRKARGEDN